MLVQTTTSFVQSLVRVPDNLVKPMLVSMETTHTPSILRRLYRRIHPADRKRFPALFIDFWFCEGGRPTTRVVAAYSRQVQRSIHQLWARKVLFRFELLLSPVCTVHGHYTWL